MNEIPSNPSQSSPASVKGTCWDKRRKEILAWLQKFAPPLAEIYQCIVLLLFEVKLPARGRMIAHGVREIGNNLTGYVGQRIVDRVDYMRDVGEILKLWRANSLPLGSLSNPSDTGSPPSEPVVVPIEIINRIAALLEAHEGGASRVRRNAEALFVGFGKGEGAPEAQLIPTIDQWVEVCRWFAGKTHLEQQAAKRDDEILTDDFMQKFDIFERLLHTLIGNFFDVVEELDEILAETNA